MSARDFPVVCLDIGGSVRPYDPFLKLKQRRIISFDPDGRLVPKFEGQEFHAVAIAEQTSELPFYLTRNPTCSSLKPPNPVHVNRYTFAERFSVVSETTVEAVALAEFLEQESVTADWIKLDTQGADMDILAALPDEVLHNLTAVSIEPGIYEFYQGENTFMQMQDFLTRHGFFFADLELTEGVLDFGRLQMPRLIKEHGFKKSVVAIGGTYLNSRFFESGSDAKSSAIAKSLGLHHLASEPDWKLILRSVPRLSWNLIQRLTPARVMRLIRGEY